jgi:hypothetical protein
MSLIRFRGALVVLLGAPRIFQRIAQLRPALGGEITGTFAGKPGAVHLDDVVDACCEAWNAALAEPGTISSVSTCSWPKA